MQPTTSTTEEELEGPKLTTILYWNSFFDSKDFTFGFGQQPLVDAQCPVSSCHMTDDRSLFNQSDVVVFSFQGMNLTDLPAYRFPHQRFVFYEMESPQNTDSRPMRDPAIRHGFFNWTMTYRLDSDIVHRDSYGVFVPYQRNLPSRYPIPRRGETEERKAILRNPSTVDVSGKTKLVAWFVSHCNTTSKREEYVRELSQHVPVDIYGKCGNLSCSNRGDCWKMLKRDYKFYIGFENSLCPDYVTEKLTRSLLLDTVPIVFGGVDYSIFAPPHSYINVRDFDSPQQLAEYLKLLDKAGELYARYFDWKRDYTVSTVSKQGWCHLCKMANTDLPAKSYPDIQEWWIGRAKCLPGWTPPAGKS